MDCIVSLDLFTYLENLRGRVIPLDLAWNGMGFAAVFSDCGLGHGVVSLWRVRNFLRLLRTVLLTKYVIYREFLLFPKASTSIQAGGTAPDNCKDWLTLQDSCVADWLGLTSTSHRRVVAARTLEHCSPVARLVRIRPVP